MAEYSLMWTMSQLVEAGYWESVSAQTGFFGWKTAQTPKRQWNSFFPLVVCIYKGMRQSPVYQTSDHSSHIGTLWDININTLFWTSEHWMILVAMLPEGSVSVSWFGYAHPWEESSAYWTNYYVQNLIDSKPDNHCTSPGPRWYNVDEFWSAQESM